MRLWTVASVPGIQPVVRRPMALGAGEPPPHQEKSRLRARCMLIKTFTAEGSPDLAKAECKTARDELGASIRGSGKWVTLTKDPIALPWHLSVAAELASLHFDCNDHDRGVHILEWTAAHLGQPLELTKSTTSYFLATACMLYERLDIEEALPWLERALTASTIANGPTSALSTHIRDALRRQHALRQQPAGRAVAPLSSGIRLGSSCAWLMRIALIQRS